MTKNMHSPQHSCEICHQKPKAFLVLGALGSGKTQFLNNFLPILGEEYPDIKPQLVINDIGQINIDAGRLGGKNIEALKNGCICCEDLSSFVDTIQKHKKGGKLLIIEPSGIAAGESIHQALKLNGYDVQTMTLLDIEHFAKRTPQEKTIMKHQLSVSNMVGLTWLGKDESPIHNFLCENGKHANFHIDIEGNVTTFREIIDRVISCPHEHEQYVTKKHSLFCTHSHDHYHENCSHSHGLKSVHIHTQNPFSTQSLEKISNYSQQELQNVIDFLGENLIRAKGNIGEYAFDCVHGELQFSPTHLQENVANFITKTPLSPDIFEIANWRIYSKEESDGILAELYQDCKEYFRLEEMVQKNKNSQDANDRILTQKIISDRMKYPNPYIWLQYKLEAYKDSPQHIVTLGDLKKHCAPKGYICGKRLAFLSEILRNHYGIDVFEEKYDKIPVLECISQDMIENISQNTDLMQERWKYEYFYEGEKCAKWENFVKK